MFFIVVARSKGSYGQQYSEMHQMACQRRGNKAAATLYTQYFGRFGAEIFVCGLTQLVRTSAISTPAN